MTTALETLMNGVIDYAGLFPPANLPLEDAVREYLAIRESPEAWMLGRFVLPASRLAELKPWADELNSGDIPLRLALLGDSSEEPGECVRQVQKDLQHLREIVRGKNATEGDVSLDLPLPKRLADDGVPAEGFADFYNAVDSALDRTGMRFEVVFFEAPAAHGAPAARESLIRAMEGLPGAGFKLRTGGLTPGDFPTVADVAGVVEACGRHRCRWKATAGLHHAVRQTDAKLGVTMHGFLNVLFAAVLARSEDLSRRDVEAILAEENPAVFDIDNSWILWKDHSADIADIRAARHAAFTSFGSCSFAEPRDGLKKLGLL